MDPKRHLYYGVIIQFYGMLVMPSFSESHLSLVSSSQLSRVTAFFIDRQYYSHVLKFALPIALQQLIFSGLNLVSSVMVGQLGDTTVAAVGLANQIFFLLNLLIFGIGSGAAMFTAQLWGQKDISNIRRVLGLSLTLSLASAVIFLVLAELFPSTILGIYSRDPEVIALGSSYLRIFAFSFIFFGITATISLVLRSIGEVRLPVTVTVCALILNIILSYVLIFGKLGLPALGVNGAAYSILISRGLECIILISMTYYLKLPIAGNLRELFSFDLVFAGKVLRPVMPIVINEILWSLGITAYQVIYARIGTEQLAAINISVAIVDLAMIVFIGLGNATSILVGNFIGSGDEGQAHVYAGRSLALSAIGGMVIGILILLLSPFILSLYKVSPQTIDYAQSILLVSCATLWIRMTNLVIFIGVLRAGGDTRYGLILDGFTIWLVGVPLTAYGAFVLHLPIHLVYLLTMSEELVKWSLGLWRYFSKKWIHNLTETVSAIN